MRATGNIPTAVLSQQLSDAITGRRVRTAVFTTYTFDPGFFELQILPLLFDQSFSQADKVRRIQLEDALRSVDNLAVYYDRSALAQDGEPAQLDYRRLDVSRATGCFHPKLLLLLLDEPLDDSDKGDSDNNWAPFQTLLVGVLSANLTRAGWWESVECGHIDEIKDRDWRDPGSGRESSPRPSSFRKDLLLLLSGVRNTAVADEDHTALDEIHHFLRHRTRIKTFTHSTTRGKFRTRIFSGQHRQNLAGWLADLRIYQGWNLEVISPFFDPHGAGPLEDLVELLEPRETRVYLPRDPDGTARVTTSTYRAVDEIAFWSEPASEIVSRKQGQGEGKLPPRRVHAKVYRIWSGQGGDLLLVGSVNLTQAAHSHGQAGNLEAAFLVDVTDKGYPRRWWLKRCEDAPGSFAKNELAEEDGLQRATLDLSVRYDWGTAELAYRLMGPAPEGFMICETTGGALLEVDKPTTDRWVVCEEDAAAKVKKTLVSSSFLLVRHAEGTWRLLVREENMGHRPSLLMNLTPEEILEYWSLLTSDQRAACIERIVGRDAEIDGIPVFSRHSRRDRNTLFDRFAGIYHAFGCLRRHVEDALSENREREAEARLLGAKYDSLPSLLEKSFNREEEDAIIRYVTFLCARQTRDVLAADYRDFFLTRRERVKNLDLWLDRLPEVRNRLPLDRLGGGEEFIKWYEKAFLKTLVPEEIDS